MTIDEIIKQIQTFFIDNGLNLLAALAIFVIGYIVIKILLSITQKLLNKSKLDVTLHKFTLSFLKILLLIILILMCIAVVIPSILTSFVTILGAAGLAISLAIKDSLSNLAGGMLVLVSKPFAVGDFVEFDSTSGTVSEIGLIYTVLKTPDNKKVFVPNGDVAKAKITNYSSENERRLDLVFSISYEDDIETAKKIISDIAESSRYVIRKDESLIRVCKHDSNAVNIACQIWVEGANYWKLYYDMLEDVKKQFDGSNITIPNKPTNIIINNNPERI